MLLHGCPARGRTWTLLIQSQTCCQLHHRTIYVVKLIIFLLYLQPDRSILHLIGKGETFIGSKTLNQYISVDMWNATFSPQQTSSKASTCRD